LLLAVACSPPPTDTGGGGGGTQASGGGSSAAGGGSGESGGGTSASGGGTSASGGGTSANGGGTSASGGGTSASGGGTSASGGGTGATGGGTGGTGGGFGTGNDAGITCDGGETFTVVDPLLFSGCTGFGQFSCHGRAPFEAGLVMTAGNHYSSLVGVPSTTNPAKLRIKPGDPLGSFVVQKLTDTQNPATEGGPMPQAVEGLIWHPPPPENLRLLECWIVQGAQNN
jgi:hypothetical protein